jgi:hypothetical protein
MTSVRSALISQRFCVRPASKRWFLKTTQVTMKHCPFWCHVGTHVDSTSSLHSHIHSVGPSSVVWSVNLDWLRLFHQRECFEVQSMVTDSQSCVWSGPDYGQKNSPGLECLWWLECLLPPHGSQLPNIIWESQSKAARNNLKIMETDEVTMGPRELQMPFPWNHPPFFSAAMSHALITPNFPSSFNHESVGDYMFENRCWPTYLRRSKKMWI